MKRVLFGFFSIISILSTSLFAASKDQEIFKAQEDVQIEIAPLGQNNNDDFGAAEFLRRNEKFTLRPELLSQIHGEGFYTIVINAQHTAQALGLILNEALPSGFVLLKMSRGPNFNMVLDVNLYDVDIENIPVIQTENGFGNIYINQARRTEGSDVCITVELDHANGRANGHVSLFNRADDKHLVTFKINSGAGGYTYQKQEAGFRPVVTAAAKQPYEELQPQQNNNMRAANSPHKNSDNMKRALLGIMNALPNPAPNAAQRPTCHQKFTAARQEVLDTIRRYKADPLVKQRFNIKNRHGVVYYNALDTADRLLGQEVHDYDPRHGIFNKLCAFMNLYSLHFDNRDRAELPDDIFYIDQIFWRVWELIKTYPGETPDRTEIDRAVLKDIFIKNIDVMVQEGYGDCTCNAGKLAQLVLTLQGYYDFATFDDQTNDGEIEAKPKDVVATFMLAVNAELGKNPQQLTPDMQALQNVAVSMEIAPEGVEVEKLSQRAFDQLVRSTTSSFSHALRNIRQKFNRDILPLFSLVSQKIEALNFLKEDFAQWQRNFDIALRQAQDARKDRVDAGDADDDSSLPAALRGRLANAPAQVSAAAVPVHNNDDADVPNLYPNAAAGSAKDKAVAPQAADFDEQFYNDLIIAAELANADQRELDQGRQAQRQAHADRVAAEAAALERQRQENLRRAREAAEAERREQERLIEEQLCNDMIAAAALAESDQRDLDTAVKGQQHGGAAAAPIAAARRGAPNRHDDDNDAGLYDVAPLRAGLHAQTEDEAFAAALEMSRLAAEEETQLRALLAGGHAFGDDPDDDVDDK